MQYRQPHAVTSKGTLSNLAAYYYLDTNVLAGWCQAESALPRDIDLACQAAMSEILSVETDFVALSELTLVEYYDVIMTHLRDTAAPHYDDEWADSSIDKVMRHIAEEKLAVIASPARATEHALQLVLLAARSSATKFKAWDATHLIVASDLARRASGNVKLVTADRDFRRFLDCHPYFSRMIELHLVTA